MQDFPTTETQDATADKGIKCPYCPRRLTGDHADRWQDHPHTGLLFCGSRKCLNRGNTQPAGARAPNLSDHALRQAATYVAHEYRRTGTLPNRMPFRMREVSKISMGNWIEVSVVDSYGRKATVQL